MKAAVVAQRFGLGLGQRLGLVLGLGLGLLAGLPGAAGAAAQTKISIGDVGSGSSLHWTSYVAMEKGFYKAADIEIEYIPVQTSAGVVQQLSAGSLDFGSGGFPDPIRAIDKGGAITIFRVEGQVAPYELMVRNTIKTYADLKGKKVMVDSPKGIARLYLERMMAPRGVKYDDFDPLFAGATSARFQALISGGIDATLLNPPFNFKAAAAGFSSLGKAAPSSLDIPFNGYAVSKAWIGKHRLAMDGFLLGYQKGVDWFADKANRTEAIDILVKYAKLAREECEQTYNLYQDLKIFDRVGAVEGSGLDNLIKIMKADSELEGSTNLSRFADLSIVTPK